jgi:uncharacterized phage protein (TIGR01671 family)
MRSIKFRAWDNETRKMYSIRALFFNDDGSISGILSDPEMGGVFLGQKTHVDGKYYDDFILMQNVGFLDKNGSEIFEGDIYEGYVIRYAANLHEFLGGEAGWFYERDGWESFNKLECDEDIEIIGNIYENPELMYKFKWDKDE